MKQKNLKPAVPTLNLSTVVRYPWSFMISVTRQKLGENYFSINIYVSCNILKDINKFVLYFTHLFSLLKNTKLE